MPEIIASIVKSIEVIMEKYGLWETVFAFTVLFTVPIFVWKLDVILAAIKS